MRLLAGIWDQAELNSLIHLLEKHAVPAIWTHDHYLPEPAIDEAARIRNLLEVGEIVAVESTLVTQAGASFHDAVNSAKQRLMRPGNVFRAVDIRSGRKRGVRPLPLRVDGDQS